MHSFMGDFAYCICSWRIDYCRAYIHLVCSRISGCFAAAVLGANPVVQIILFLVVAVGLLAATRPWAKKYINSRTQRTNADRVIGETIRITERVSNLDQTGMAVVNGQEWTVRTRDDREIIEQGAYARVLEISGVKLIVEKA